jgi:hypothetical protein
VDYQSGSKQRRPKGSADLCAGFNYLKAMEATNNNSFVAMRRLMRRPPQAERCDFCSAELAEEHQHLIEPEPLGLVCVCDGCAVLFDSDGETIYRRVPRRGRLLPDFRLADLQWESLMIPIGLAFIFKDGAGKLVALYPSPAGPTESLLDVAAWEEIELENHVLREMRPCVEALLVNRLGAAREYFIAPIDECFKLAGLVRANWRGLSGGAEMWKLIEQFFAGLKMRSGASAGAPNA